MTTIADLFWIPTEAAYFVDDQLAIRQGAARDGFAYAGPPVTPGFTRIRQPGKSLTVVLATDDGQAFTGDCAEVQYSGVAGRAAPFSVREAERHITGALAPRLAGQPVDSFRQLCDTVRAAAAPPWLAYGVSQALLRAVAWQSRRPMAGVILGEWGLTVPSRPVPVFCQGGEATREAVDRMILKRADALPHGLVNNAVTRVGSQGEILAELVAWVTGRIARLAAGEGYRPVLHFDVYGTLGEVFGDIGRIAGYLLSLEAIAAPCKLRIEHPLDAGSKSGQIAQLAALRAELRRRGSRVELVADEWCNTLADVEEFAASGCADMIHVKTPDLGALDHTASALLACRRSGVAAYCGGTCNETVGSAQACAQVALACGADLILAKPGMGADEGLSVVRNEMRVAMAQLARPGAPRYRHRRGDILLPEEPGSHEAA
jgi:methylaspartate ammonia-lyase